MVAITREREMLLILWLHPQEEGMRATVVWGCCHIRGATFSKLPLKKNFIHQDGKANIKGAGNWRENLYKQCLCREKGL